MPQVLWICRAYGVTVLSVATCPSPRKGFHVYVEIVPPAHAETAWRLQFLLGDDCLRVSLNRARLRAGFSGWNKLFEEPEAKVTTIYRRPRPVVGDSRRGTLLPSGIGEVRHGLRYPV